MVMPIKNTSTLLGIAEIRFNPILNIAEYIAQIQDVFRMSHYTEFAHSRNPGFQVAQNGHEKTLIPTNHDLFQFSDFNKCSNFRINTQFLTYQSSNYKDFDTFITLFLEGVFIVNKILNVPIANRIGLRLIDHLMCKRGEKIESYLANQETALFHKLGGASIYSHSEIKHQYKDVQLCNRVKVFQHSDLEFPSDIEPGDMVFKEKFVTYKGPSAIIDTDSFIENRMKLNLETLRPKFYELHDLAIYSFEASVSNKAKKVG